LAATAGLSFCSAYCCRLSFRLDCLFLAATTGGLSFGLVPLPGFRSSAGYFFLAATAGRSGSGGV
jgi:hypothetical protein